MNRVQTAPDMDRMSKMTVGLQLLERSGTNKQHAGQTVFCRQFADLISDFGYRYDSFWAILLRASFR